jgi:hypothetical protein
MICGTPHKPGSMKGERVRGYMGDGEGQILKNKPHK